MKFEEFYTNGIKHHLKQRKRLDTKILIFVLHTLKDNKMKISPIISYESSPMDHAQGVIDKLQPDMYLICAESWIHIAKGNFKEFRENYQHGQISQMDDKIECIAFVAKTRDGKEEHYEGYEIIRKDGKIVDYKKQNWSGMKAPKLT